MIRELRRIALSCGLTLMPALLLAQQQPRRGRPEDAAAPCAACGACGGGLMLGFIGIIILNIVLLVWVARDAKARSMDSAILWMILVMFFGPLGLVLYVFSRPQGNLIECPHCKNKRLEASAKCPHCGNA
jgi:hypothetical protein